MEQRRPDFFYWHFVCHLHQTSSEYRAQGQQINSEWEQQKF